MTTEQPFSLEFAVHSGLKALRLMLPRNHCPNINQITVVSELLNFLSVLMQYVGKKEKKSMCKAKITKEAVETVSPLTI